MSSLAPSPPAPSPTLATMTKPLATSPTTSSSYQSTDAILSALDTVMRITLAGFGGALAGLSLSRRGNIVGGVSSSINSINNVAHKITTSNAPKMTSKAGQGAKQELSSKHNHPRHRPIRTTPPSSKPFVDRELPAAWAMACMAFTGVIEFTRVVSPTTLMGDLVTAINNGDLFGGEGNVQNENENENVDSDATNPQPNDNDNNGESNNQKITLQTEDTISFFQNHSNIFGNQQYLTTISDYILGGSLAGALFKGSAVRTRAGARIDASLMGMSTPTPNTLNLSAVRGKPLSGIIPGAVLGLVAGVMIVFVDYAQIKVEEYFGSEEEGDLHEEDNLEVVSVERASEREEEVPEDIKGMSNEELMRSIENLKKGRPER